MGDIPFVSFNAILDCSLRKKRKKMMVTKLRVMCCIEYATSLLDWYDEE